MDGQGQIQVEEVVVAPPVNDVPAPISAVGEGGRRDGTSKPKPFDLEELMKEMNNYQLELDEDTELRDKIHGIVRGLEKAVRKVNFMLLDIHRDSSKNNFKLSAAKSALLLETNIHPLIEELKQAVPEDGHYKFNEIYRHVFQRLAGAACTIHFLEKGTLCSLAECGELLKVSISQGGRPGASSSSTAGKTVVLEFEEYVAGLLEMGGELSRVTRNCITFGGSVETVMSIHECLNQLHTSLYNITFQDEYLRKRHDGLQYHLRTVEEVVYDLKVRQRQREDGVNANFVEEGGNAVGEMPPSSVSAAPREG